MGHILSAKQRALAGAGIDSDTGWLTSCDPRVRIVAAVAFAILVVSLHALPAVVVALGISLLALASVRLPWRQTLRQMAAMDGFIVFMLALLPFTVPGTPLFHVFGFSFSLEGLRQAVEIGLKANAIILMLMVLVGTMEPVALGYALHRLHAPETLVHLLMFTVRYISVLHQEYSRLRAAMKARGFRLRNSLHTYKSIGYLVGMMLVRSVDRSERIIAAMKCRGFNGSISLLSDMQFGRKDYIFSGLVVCIFLILIGLEISFGAAR